MATDSPSPRATLPPPPIPRKHPSRQSISHSNSASPASERSRRPFPDLSSSGGSVGSSSEYASSNTGASGRLSGLYENDETQHPHASPSGLIAPSPSHNATLSSSRGPLSTGSVGGGMAANVVGLGSTRVMDFKDWVKAGRESRDEPAAPKENGDSAAKKQYQPDQQSQTSSSNTPPPRPRASLDVNSSSSIPSSHSIAHSMSSISIDSSRSPQTEYMRSPLEVSTDRRETPLESSTSTARRLSYELSRHVNGSSNGSSRRVLSLSPTHDPDSRYSSPRDNPNSPLERRFSRRLAMPMGRETSNGTVETVTEEEELLEGHHDQHRSPRKSLGATSRDAGSALDERIRQAEEKLTRRQSAGSARLSGGAVATPPSGRVTPLRRFGHGSRASLSSRAPMSPTLMSGGRSNGHTSSVYDAREQHDLQENEYERDRDNTSSSGGSRNLGKIRPSLPTEFQNGRMHSPSPKPGDSPALRRPLRFSSIDTQRQPGRHPYDLESPSAQSFATARPASGMDGRDSPWLRDRREAREELLQDFESPSHSHAPAPAHHSTSTRRELPTHGRAGSVLETASDRYRYGLSGSQSHQRLSHISSSNDIASRRISALLDRNRDYSSHRDLASIAGDNTISRHSRDFGREFSISSRALGPSDSVSAVGSSRAELESGGQRKDPLEVIRRLEETRNQHNRRWEEDRAASVLGDSTTSSGYRYQQRASTRLDDVTGRASSRLDDMGGPRASSRLDDIGGRAGSRLSGTFRVTPRSATSTGSYGTYDSPAGMRSAPATRRFPLDEGSVLDSPLHGRGGPPSVLHPVSEPRPRRSQTSFGSRVSGASFSSGAETDHGRNLVDAARMLSRGDDSAAAAKLGAVADVMERANTGVRAASTIASELVLDLDLDDKAAMATVRDRLPRLQITLREAGRASDQAVRDLTEALLGLRGSTPAGTPARAREDSDPPRRTPLEHLRHSSPATSPGVLRRDGRSESIGSLAALASRGTPTRFEGHGLGTIEQSPPKPPSKRASLDLSLTTSVDQGPASPDADSKEFLARSPPRAGFPEERMLRKQASTLSTHTVRQRPLSFAPAHAPEPTTAVSTAMASPNSKDRSRRGSTMSVSSILSEEHAHAHAHAKGAALERKGTFGHGEARGALVSGGKRESVSDRFRKHLNGE